ncbi:hypothetical protein [Mangrovibacterium marinum]|uniref:Sugar lactone lactonase YvrE n=1 Tax=Mangrovibacterium marinum TaxID=1639118 RepID=A0A2T5C4D0_9BACT|nr:hypothetical protein [Mangrovibacterium marinum]PTN09730.1 hypothetical protein C8N47_10314 [Mangrovibacterium marinum]
MKKTLFLLLILSSMLSVDACCQHLVEIWRTGPVLSTPESVLYDATSGNIYVANINGNPTDKDGNGFISLLKPDGTIVQKQWVTGLNAPKGMAVSNGKLYVSDIDQLIEIEISKAQIIARYPAPGAIFLNDVAASQDGTIFVSDNRAGRIHQLKNGMFSIWLEGDDFIQTNGLFIENGILYAGSEQLKAIDIQTKAVEIIQNNCQGIDGLAKDELGNFVFSNWPGRIFYLHNGQQTKLWDSTANQINTADIWYATALKLLLVPTFFDNQLVAYQIKHE